MKISLEIVYDEYGLDSGKFIHFEINGQMVKITVESKYSSDDTFEVNRKEFAALLAVVAT